MILKLFTKKLSPSQLSLVRRQGFLTANLPELSAFPKSIQNYESLHKFSIENRELFWGTIAKSRLQWYQDFKKVTEGNFGDEDFHLKWFIDGKLNVSGSSKRKTHFIE